MLKCSCIFQKIFTHHPIFQIFFTCPYSTSNLPHLLHFHPYHSCNIISLCSRSGTQACPSNACVGDSNKRKMAMCGESRVTLKASQGSDINSRYAFVLVTRLLAVFYMRLRLVWHCNEMPSCVLRTYSLLDSISIIYKRVCVCVCVHLRAYTRTVLPPYHCVIHGTSCHWELLYMLRYHSTSAASHNNSIYSIYLTSGGGLISQLLCVGQSRSVHPAVRWLCISLTGSLVKAERTGVSMRWVWEMSIHRLISLPSVLLVV